MQNDEGQNMDLYIPRKWYLNFPCLFFSSCFFSRQRILVNVSFIVMFFCSSATNRLITSKDHASVQINIGHVDASGHYTGQFTTFALCGFVRAQVIFLLLYFSPRIRNLLWFFGCSVLKRSSFIVFHCFCCWFSSLWFNVRWFKVPIDGDW